MVPLSFAGHDFLALPEAALYWPAHSALLVADLHFEKASWFGRFGQFLPPHDSQATLDMIEALVERTGAQAVWSLGDSFHDADGAARLPERARERLEALTGRLDWLWITGNHDVGMAQTPGGRRLAEAEVDGIWLRHEADPADPRPEISGHFHPKLRLSLRGRHVSRRCFVGSSSKLILPAMGALTGGLDVAHREIRRAVGPGAMALVPVADRLLRFPLT
jgi:DNA ligase-associated metallophosphoesterase